MRPSAATLLALACDEARYLSPRSSTAGSVSLPLQRRQFDPLTAVARDQARLRRRQSNTVEAELENDLSLYFANLSLGTPAQQFQMHLDTGSSDLWVNVPSSSLCQQNQCQGGTYNSGDSSTYAVLNTDFNITYVDGSGASGDYVTDVLQFAGITLDKFQFGTGETSTSSQGVLGIGYTSNEVQVNKFGGAAYPNLPQALKDNGHIAANIYSLWLNDLDASMGEILFGGVDSAKYSGELTTIPIVPQDGGYYQIVIAMTGLTINGTNSSSSELPVGVLLDSGSTLTYLPTSLAQQVFSSVNAVYDSSIGAAYAACSLANSGRTLDYSFSGKVISVPFDELFLPAGTNSKGQQLTLQNGEPACIFGVTEIGEHIAVLGDTFLRSAFVVYDLENNEIGLAQTVYNTTATNVQAISSGGSIPGATAVSNPVTNVDFGASGGPLGGPTNSTNAASGSTVSVAMSAIAAGIVIFVGLVQ